MPSFTLCLVQHGVAVRHLDIFKRVDHQLHDKFAYIFYFKFFNKRNIMPPRKQCNVNVEDKKKTRQLKNEPKNNSEKMSQVWSVHEKIFLVQSLLIQLTNIPHVPCNRGLQSIDWSKVIEFICLPLQRSSLTKKKFHKFQVRITNRSAAECQSELMSIVNDVKKYRTLREVLEAYNEEESMKQVIFCLFS